MSPGDSVRTRGEGGAFHHVTLLYIGVENGVWAVSRWHTRIGKEGLEATELELLKYAQSPDPEKRPEFSGFGFEGIAFARHKSYFTIVLNATGYTFHDGEDTDPMWFLEKKENSSLPPPHAPVAPNKSFLDLEQVTVDGLPALRCKNYLRNGYSGAPLKDGESQGFIFNLYIRAEYAHGDKTGVVLAIDPSGDNTGPDG
jgi:hypothetical protein